MDEVRAGETRRVEPRYGKEATRSTQPDLFVDSTFVTRYSIRMQIGRVISAAIWIGFALAFFALAFCAVLAGASPVRQPKPVAAPAFVVNGGTDAEQRRIAKLEAQLNFNKVAMVSQWQVTILNALDWDYMLRQYNEENQTVSAFTLPHQTHTFISQDYITQFPDARVKWTLAHESGHLVCECESEQTANDIAAVLTGQSRP